MHQGHDGMHNVDSSLRTGDSGGEPHLLDALPKSAIPGLHCDTKCRVRTGAVHCGVTGPPGGPLRDARRRHLRIGRSNKRRHHERMFVPSRMPLVAEKVQPQMLGARHL